MSIESVILRLLRERFLSGKRLLVLYDPTGRFGPVAEKLAQSEGAEFLDARTRLLDVLKTAQKALDAGLKQGLVIRAPWKAPESNEEKLFEPFSALSEIGARFPERASDAYLQICLGALPKKEAAVRTLFENADEKGPDFAIVDALFGDGSQNWPVLRARSRKTSEEEILKWLLLAPDEVYEEALAEMLDFGEAMLGVRIKNDARPREIRESFWSALLMTEFMAARGEKAPEVYANVSAAPIDRQGTVLEVIQDLRSSSTSSERYVTEADRTARLFGIGEHLEDITPAATRCTFREEAEALRGQAVARLIENRTDEARAILEGLSRSVWATEDRGFQEFAQAAIDFAQALEGLERSFSTTSLKDLIAFYAEKGATADRLARRFAEAAEVLIVEEESPAGTLRDKLLRRHKAWAETVHARFLAAVDREGWPSAEVGSIGTVFSRVVDPLLQKGGRVVYLIVDALRYEAAESLARELKKLNPQVRPLCAALPTITEVGKTALLPRGDTLRVEADYADGSLHILLNGTEMTGVESRMKVLSSRFGDRFRQMTTAEFLKKKPSELEKTELLCLRYDDIDRALENGGTGMLQAVPLGIRHLARVIRRIEKAFHFTDLVIATDHGFVLNPVAGPFEKCEKPGGNWIETHDRFLLGDGTPHEANVLLPSEHLGLRTNAKHAAFPRALCAYRTARKFFHGGLSLPEAVVPLMTIHFGGVVSAQGNMPSLKLVPKKTRFTTLLPKLTLEVPERALDFGVTHEFPVQIEVLDKATGRPAGFVMNNDSGVLTVVDGDVDFRVKLEEFKGGLRTIRVKALDPETG